MQKLDPQFLTPMLEFVHASKIHVFEFNNSIFAFAGVETTFYTMSKKHMKRMKCEFQNAIQKPTKIDFSSTNLLNNVRACVRICATHLRIWQRWFCFLKSLYSLCSYNWSIPWRSQNAVVKFWNFMNAGQNANARENLTS